jgi:hypothetical protein
MVITPDRILRGHERKCKLTFYTAPESPSLCRNSLTEIPVGCRLPTVDVIPVITKPPLASTPFPRARGRRRTKPWTRRRPTGIRQSQMSAHSISKSVTMIRCFRPATQDIRDLFTLQTSRKHDCKAPRHAHSTSSLENWAHGREILLQWRKINMNSTDQGPFGVPKVTGSSTKYPTKNEKSRMSSS